MNQFLFAPVVENAAALTRSALPNAPVVIDATDAAVSRPAPTTAHRSTASGLTKRAALRLAA